jgi:hypothetical protein
VFRPPVEDDFAAEEFEVEMAKLLFEVYVKTDQR